MTTPAIAWRDGAVEYIDQRRLPGEVVVVRATTVDEVVDAIATLAVRGAPCIGIAGAYGVALARATIADDTVFRAAAARVRAARPTAVNLAWAVDRVLARADGDILAEAQAIQDEQRAIDRAIATHGAALISEGAIITHCNTGPLATGGEGTALGVIVAAHKLGKRIHVFADETRPLLQGARLTMFELGEAGIPATLIVDGAAAMTIKTKNVVAAIVGADRIAMNGDAANKIGTYSLAIAAAHHGIPFYVAAPRSTFDFTLRDGGGIEIEERSPDEVRGFGGIATAPANAAASNPAFDVTPGRLITAFITEFGISRAPYDESLPDLATRPNVFAATFTSATR